MKKLIVAGFVLALAGCGGGGSQNSTPSANVSALSVPVVDRPYFIDKSELMPDLRPYFDKLCGNDTQVGDFLVIDFNGDGLKDIVMSLWCDLSWDRTLVGTPYNGPIKNTLLLIKQKSDQTFYVANQEYFGKDIVPLSGAGGPGLMTYGDYNNDGKIDFAFARSKEDGRMYVNLPDGTSNWSAYPQVLMSTPTGFELQTLPYYYVNNQIVSVKNYNGVDEIIVGGNKFTYINNSWIQTGVFPMSGIATVSFSKNNTNYILTEINNRDVMGLSLNRVDRNGINEIDNFLLGSISLAKFSDPTGRDPSTTQHLVNIKGENWMWVSLQSSCSAGTVGNKNIFYVIVEGVPIKNYDPNKVYVYGTDIHNYDYVGRLLKITIDNEKISSIDWVGENITYNKDIVCVDVNNDGVIDVVVNRWLDNTYNPLNQTTNPYVFFNLGTQYVKVQDVKFPSASSTFHGQNTNVYDLNNDGKLDLFYTPGGYKDSNYKGPVKIQYFTGEKSLD